MCCDVQFSREPKSCLVSSEYGCDVPPKHPMWASMWSGNVCNALNSSMKLAVMQQTSNTLIIDGSLLGAAVLYQCANKMRNKWVKRSMSNEREDGGGSALPLFLGNQTRRHLKSERRGKQCRGPGVISLNTPLMWMIESIKKQAVGKKRHWCLDDFHQKYPLTAICQNKTETEAEYSEGKQWNWAAQNQRA